MGLQINEEDDMSVSSENVLAKGTARGTFSLKEHLLSAKTFAAFFLSALVLYFLFTKIEFQKLTTVIGETNLLLFTFGFVVFYFSIFLRGIRWHILLGNLGFHVEKKASVEILFISWFVNVIIPAKIGDLYRSYLLRQNYRYSASEVLGSVLTERVFDMVVLLGLFVITTVLSFREEFPYIIRYLLLATIVITSLMLGVLFMMKYHGNLVRRLLPVKIADIYGRFERGTLGSIRNVHLIISCTLLIWVLEAGRLYFVTNALNVRLPMMLIMFIALASSLLTSLPITPAGLGAVEFAIVGILTLFHVDINLAVSIALLDRIVSYWSIMFIGLPTFLASKKII